MNPTPETRNPAEPANPTAEAIVRRLPDKPLLNAREVGIGSREKLTLVCNVPPEQELAVTFVNRGGKSFTAPRSIPDSGAMTEDK